MSAEIYYFTGTGNSLKIARDIASGLGDAEVVSIPKTLKGNLKSNADCIGVVFPVYMWGPPLIVRDFCEKIKILPNSYLFAVTNYGGSMGGTLNIVDSIFRKRGLSLSAGFGIRMPGNYTPLYGAISEHKQREMFAKESGKVEQIVRTVAERKTAGVESGGFFTSVVLSKVLYGMMSGKIPEMARKFRINDKCNGCGVCEQVCPVNNITMKDGKPQWSTGCQQCMACLQWCPQEAIESGKNTPGRKRYRNPDVLVNDLKNQTGQDKSR